MKLKAPFFNDNFKKPANIPCRITLRRGKGNYKTLCGVSQADLLMSTGSTVRNQTEIVNSRYGLQINELNLYVKRLVLSETQKMVLYEQPLMIYDSPFWSAQSFDLTGDSLTQNINFQSLPQLVLVGLVPKRNLVDPDPSPVHFNKRYSVYNTCRPYEKSFRELFINTSYGRIPESPYQSAFASGSVNTAQSGRAYEEFLKATGLPRHPLGFKLWSEQHTWYAFILNTDGENPNFEASRKGRSTINVVAGVVDAGAPRGGLPNADVSLVVIGMELNQMTIQDLKNVAVSI